MAVGGLEGLYTAIVVGIDEFSERGEIRIRILGMTHEDTSEYARVLVPFGGAENMGIQWLPSVGTYGLIAYERGIAGRPIWIGSIARFWGKALEDGTAHPVEAEDPTDFIIKQQHLRTDDQEVSSTDNKVENVIKMNEEELTFSKFHQNDNYEYQDSSYDPDDGKAINLIRLKDDSIKIKFRNSDNDMDRVIILDDDNIKLEFEEGKRSITMNEEETTIKQEDTTIVIHKDGNVNITGTNTTIEADEANIQADKIVLNGETGTGMFYEIFRDFVNQGFNQHIHGTPTGPSSPPTTPFTNASQGESQNVKLS